MYFAQSAGQNLWVLNRPGHYRPPWLQHWYMYLHKLFFTVGLEEVIFPIDGQCEDMKNISSSLRPGSNLCTLLSNPQTLTVWFHIPFFLCFTAGLCGLIDHLTIIEEAEVAFAPAFKDKATYVVWKGDEIYHLVEKQVYDGRHLIKHKVNHHLGSGFCCLNILSASNLCSSTSLKNIRLLKNRALLLQERSIIQYTCNMAWWGWLVILTPEVLEIDKLVPEAKPRELVCDIPILRGAHIDYSHPK